MWNFIIFLSLVSITFEHTLQVQLISTVMNATPTDKA
jgi:hypothetical protein